MVAPAGRQGILSLTIKDKSALYAAYMPFIRNGGLFIPTNKSYHLGDEVFMLLTLMEDKEHLNELRTLIQDCESFKVIS